MLRRPVTVEEVLDCELWCRARATFSIHAMEHRCTCMVDIIRCMVSRCCYRSVSARWSSCGVAGFQGQMDVDSNQQMYKMSATCNLWQTAKGGREGGGA